MIKRYIQKTIEHSIRTYPVVGIIGPRQVGKTTFVKMLKARVGKKTVYLDLELPSDLNKLSDPQLYLEQFTDSLVIIDEIQRMPSLFALLRALVDRKKSAGRFLILGSASPELIKHASDTLAGRIIYHELTPFILPETGFPHFKQLWVRGGYPLSYLSQNEDDSFSWRESFVRTYLEMDIPQLGIHIPAMQLRMFWTMLAYSHGQLWNANKISNSIGLSAPTVRRYLDILEDTFIIRQLQPYHLNIKKRLIKSPKVYIRDSGLLHALLHLRYFEDINSNPSLGSSWEGFVIEQIIATLPDGWGVYFYRTNAGAEIDLLLVNRKNEPIAVEIKYSSSPKVSKGFWNAFEDLSCKQGFIIYPGKESYPVARNVRCLPVSMINKILSTA